MIPKALTIAGSDPSGGAGIQADLKTFSRLRVYGMAVVAALTAQNTTGVTAVCGVEPDFVAKQLDAVLDDLPPDAVKTGMLATAANVEVVAAKVRQYGITRLIVDPVLVSTSGSALLESGALDVLRRSLMPLALLVTPNMQEAEALTGSEVRTMESMEEAARTIHGWGPTYVLIKGGHLEGDAIDVLFDGARFSRLRSERIAARDSHGTGCVLSAAIAAYVALGSEIPEAVQLGKEFVSEAIRQGLRIGSGAGPCDPLGLGK
jgi:hydroxymethylpyrimidine/phosphomethylpyrimidine kinase